MDLLIINNSPITPKKLFFPKTKENSFEKSKVFIFLSYDFSSPFKFKYILLLKV